MSTTAAKSKSKKAAVSGAPTVVKIKKSVLAEQERLVIEAQQAAATEQQRKETERKKKEESESRQREEQRISLQSEHARLYSQSLFDAPFLSARSTDLSQLREQVEKKTSWEKYLECNPLPDVTCEAALNTYLSMWRSTGLDGNSSGGANGGNSSSTSGSGITITATSGAGASSSHSTSSTGTNDDEAPNLRYKSLIESCSTTERVIDLLQEVHSEACEELQIRKILWVNSFIHLLRNLTVLKLDTLTSQFLSRYDEFENHETRVMNISYATQDIAYGLWVHNKKSDGASVRVKRIEFPNIGINIELPAALQKSRTSIRVVRTLFDHTSIQWDAPITSNAAGNGSNGSAKPLLSSAPQKLRILRAPISDIIEPPEMPQTMEKDVFVLAKQAEELYQAAIDAAATPTPASGAPVTTAVAGSVPAVSASNPTPPIHFVSVGGIINIEQLALPPPPKKAKGWVMRDITPLSKTIQVVPYPATSDEHANGAGAATMSAGGVGGNAAMVSTTSQAPLRVSFQIPSYIYLDSAPSTSGAAALPREPHFGYWDSRYACWRQDGIACIKYERDENPAVGGGLVHLSLNLLKPVAIIQPRALDFPYRNWSLKAQTAKRESLSVATETSDSQQQQHSSDSSPQQYEFHLQGSRFPIVFSISQDHTRLVSPQHTVLNELNTTNMLPGIALHRMARAGINVQPTIEDAAYCRKPLKNLVLTSMLHEHLSLIASCFDIAGSEFNSSRSIKKCCFRVKLNTQSRILLQGVSKRKKLDEVAAKRAAENESKVVVVAKPQDGVEQMIAQMEREGDESSGGVSVSGSASVSESASEIKLLSDALKEASMSSSAASLEEQNRLTRYAKADEWVNVLVELTHVEAPKPKQAKVQISYAQDPFQMVSGTPAEVRPATSATPAAATQSVAEGSISSSTPGGAELLKFTLIRGRNEEGLCDETPLPDCISHFSLRRCLLAYFIHLTPHDLTTALDMELATMPPIPPSLLSNVVTPAVRSSTTAGGGTHRGATAAASAHAASLDDFQPSFLVADVATLQIQQTIRRMLNLTSVFTFH